MPLKHFQDTMKADENQEGFKDETRIPKPEDLAKATDKRKRCTPLAVGLKRLGYDSKAARVMDCGTQRVYAYIFEEKRLELHRANFCRERLCPMCAMQRSRKIFAQVSQVMDAVQEERPELVPVFLTLTMRNCKGEELIDTLDTMFQGWKRLINNKRIQRLVLGWFRALEVTYNEEEDTFHPHLHAILLMPPSYFITPKDYMTTESWVRTWRTAMRVDYNPVCHIQAVDTSAGNMSGAVAEVATYTVKDTDYLKPDSELTDKLIKIFSAALKSRRLFAFGGLMKEIAKRLKLKSADDFKPEEVTDKNGVVLRKDIDYILLMYRWNIGLSRYDFEGQI